MSCSSCSTRLTRIAMCRACSACSTRWPDDAATRSATCTINGRRLTEAAGDKAASCPRGRWPDRDGIVRWWGARWHGVPMPVRLKLAAKLYADCGCLVALKKLTRRNWRGPRREPDGA